MSDTEKLKILLSDPQEGLTVEYKTWLDFETDREHKGLLAKAIIALANEGGGYIVLGFDNVKGELVASSRPKTIKPYNQDMINGIVKKFIEPSFHCALSNITHPQTNVIYPIISIPGGHTVPIMSRSETEKSIKIYSCYIRKAGPESAVPVNYRDWSKLIEQCVRNRKIELLDAIRGVIQGSGEIESQKSTTDLSLQDNFVESSKIRWRHVTASLPNDNPARFPSGHFEADFQFRPQKETRLPELLDFMRQASQMKSYSGWSPFWIPTRHEIAPQQFDGNAECWLGRPGSSRLTIDPSHADFWRVSPEVRAFFARGYIEDSHPNHGQKTVFDVTFPILTISEILLYAGRLSGLMNSNGLLQFRVRWYGLSGRQLAFVNDWMRSTGGNYKASQDAIESKASIDIDSIEDHLPEVVHSILQPLFENFSFFKLPDWLVTDEISKMRKR